MKRFARKSKLFPLMMALAFAAPVFLVAAQTPQEERASLEQQLQDLEKQIGSIENDITKTQAEKNTFLNQISILKSKIKKLDLQIAQGNRIIGDLKSQINDTQDSIAKTVQDIAGTKDQLSAILRTISREDHKGTAEILFSGATLSDFFENIAGLQALNGRAKELLDNMQKLNIYLQDQKGALESDKAQQENFVKIQLIQKAQSQQTRVQQEKLLEQTKGKESEYQKLLADKRKEADAIRSRIFQLIGVPKAPTFGQALEIATYVASVTGVRAPLVLAVLTQESNIGQNVGQCYLKDQNTGSGVRANGTAISYVMKPSRDVRPFLTITGNLGRDPQNTPVSCPIPSVGGYGGAMGPAQFIPSTWINYADRIRNISGKTADPWNIQDAFVATGLYLADNGATKKTYNAEWRAAMIYFSGTVNTRYRFYGDNVMAIAAQYAKDIKALDAQQ